MTDYDICKQYFVVMLTHDNYVIKTTCKLVFQFVITNKLY